ncbi:hypothetical protein ACEWY4_019931 [Coilia grayii]|uniref:Type-4 ice-structuring protein LS-12 n=1 Tax=Coilia grayii TaxID=363190 RepID=A0ABD1JB52_9TELE
MKFTLAVALVMLVISQGTESASLVKPDFSAEIGKVTKYFEDLGKMLTTTSTELVEKVKAYELTSQAGSLLQTLEKIQQDLTPLAASIEKQLKPLSESVQAQIKPLAHSIEAQVEDLLKKVVTQTKALLPPQ